MQTYSKSKDRWTLRTTFTAHSTSLIFLSHYFIYQFSLLGLSLGVYRLVGMSTKHFSYTKYIALLEKHEKLFIYIYILALVKKNCQRAHINLKV